MVQALAGDDIIIGSGSEGGISIGSGSASFGRSGTLDTGTGDDSISGTGTAAGYGGLSLNILSRIVTGDGHDSVSGHSKLWGIGINNSGGTIETGNGDDSITGTANSSSDGSSGYAINNSGKIDTGIGNDTIKASGIGSYGLVNVGTINTDDGNDSFVATATGYQTAIRNVDSSNTLAIINTGSGNDSIVATSKGSAIDNDAIIITGDGDDTITGISTASREVLDIGFSSGYGISNYYGKIDTGNGNDTITGSGWGYQGFGIFNSNKIDTGSGNDVVDALVGGFAGFGLISLGDGDDTLKGFTGSGSDNWGSGRYDGGKDSDLLIIGEFGTYSISANADQEGFYTLSNGNYLMRIKNFEFLANANNGTKFAFAPGISFSILPTTAAITNVTDNVGILHGTVAAAGRTNDTTPTITGTLSAALVSGESLRIFNGATLLGTATVNNTARTWSYTPSLPTTAGTTYTLTARVADAAGNLGPTSAARSFVLDTTAPATTAAITGLTDNAGILQGTVGLGGRTNDTTPTITGTLSAALAAGETLRVFNGATLLGTATVNNTARTWSYTPSLPTTAGTTYTLTARVADAAGNFGPASVARSLTLDTTPPATTAAIIAVTDNVGILTGAIAPAARTNDATPTFTGTVSAALASGETLRLFNGATLLGSATVNNTTKTWSFTPSLPATTGTSYSITARVADAAGNLGVASPARTFALDTTPPATTAAITNVTDNVGILQGTVAAAGRTDDRTPTITGTLSAALATGETLRVFNGATLLGTATVNNTTKTWSYTPTLPATAGTAYIITARVADAAGNLGPASAARSFVLDTTSPATTVAITNVTDNVGLIQGMVAAAGRTNDTTPTITGTLSAALAAGESLRIFNGPTLLGAATVNNTSKTWSYTPTLPATAGTTYNITARVADAAGNLGPASAARSFTLDTTAPTVASFLPLDGAVGVDPAANIRINASEAIQRGTGTIVLRSGSAAGPIVESFEAATSSRLSISGSALTIDPTSNLAPNTAYFLTIPAGSLIDRTGNPFAGSSTYDLRTTRIVSGGPANDILPFSATVDRLTGLGGADTFRLTSLSHSLLPTSASTPIDRITDLVTGLDAIDAPVARTLSQALNPVAMGSVAQLSSSAITALLTPANFPALTTTSIGGAATFTFNDPTSGVRTFLAINDGVAGFSAVSDAILEITGFSGSLSQLRVF